MAPDHYRITLVRFIDRERAWTDPGEPGPGEGVACEMIVYATVCPVRKVIRPWNAKMEDGNSFYLTPPERDRVAAMLATPAAAGPLFSEPTT